MKCQGTFAVRPAGFEGLKRQVSRLAGYPTYSPSQANAQWFSLLSYPLTVAGAAPDFHRLPE